MNKEFTKVLKQLFRKKKKTAVPVYLKRFETIQKLIDDDRIGIDFKQKLVVLDSSIHMLYKNDDRKYNSFFDTMRAFLNTYRGALGIKELIELEDKIDFMVVLKEELFFDHESGEFFSPPKKTAKTLLVGYYQNGKVDYTDYEEPTE